jgi:hypothetical protein
LFNPLREDVYSTGWRDIMRLRVENAKKASQRRAEREREREKERERETAMADVEKQALSKKEKRNTASLRQVAAPAVASVAAVS